MLVFKYKPFLGYQQGRHACRFSEFIRFLGFVSKNVLYRSMTIYTTLSAIEVLHEEATDNNVKAAKGKKY